MLRPQVEEMNEDEDEEMSVDESSSPLRHRAARKAKQAVKEDSQGK